jgi:hypothetical protein
LFFFERLIDSNFPQLSETKRVFCWTVNNVSCVLTARTFLKTTLIRAFVVPNPKCSPSMVFAVVPAEWSW